MQKEKFNNFITEPRKNIDSISIEEIELLQQKFPYCEIINHMSLLKAHVDNDVNFNEILLKTSVYASDRKNIFYLINPAVKIKQAIHETKNTYDFERWLQEPLLKTKSKQNNITKNIKKSIEPNDSLTTETLAEIYVEQGYYNRAIQAYEILCLKYPKKSGFFANRIEEIKNKLN